MRIANAPAQYNQSDEQQFRGTVDRQDKRNLKIGAPVYITAPDGGRWKLVVDNSGTLTTEAYTP